MSPRPFFSRSLLAEGGEGTLRSSRRSRVFSERKNSCLDSSHREKHGWIHPKMIEAAQKNPRVQTRVPLF